MGQGKCEGAEGREWHCLLREQHYEGSGALVGRCGHMGGIAEADVVRVEGGTEEKSET